MALAAAQVIDAAVALIAPAALSGGRIYPARFWPLTEADLPAGRVFADAEDVEVVTFDGIERHTLLLNVDGFVRATSNADDAMHALAAEWLALLFAGSPPYGLALQGIEREPVQESEASMARIRLRVAALFHVNRASPETIIST